MKPNIVSPSDWEKAHKQFLVKEKEFTKLRDDMSRMRRELPWKKVEKNYVFETPTGTATLADLFDGRSQLIVYHFMLGPEWKEGCPGCSFVSDHVDGAMPHLTQRDVSYVAVSRGPMAQIEAFKKRMGWNFKWVSSAKNGFNFDYHVSFTKDELAKGDVYYNFKEMKTKSEEHPGLSVFFKDKKGDIFHTYSTYGRGLDILLGTYHFIDLTPKGRDEEKLEQPMSWVRHHDKYENKPAAVVQIAGAKA